MNSYSLTGEIDNHAVPFECRVSFEASESGSGNAAADEIALCQSQVNVRRKSAVLIQQLLFDNKMLVDLCFNIYNYLKTTPSILSILYIDIFVGLRLPRASL